MNHTLKKLGTVSALVSMAFVPLTVAARTVPASLGKAVSPSDDGCFGMSYSSMSNGCTVQKSFEIPLPVDTAGSKTVYVAAYGAGPANNVGCQAAGLNREVTAVWASPRVWLAGFGSSQIITLTGAYVPASGFLYVNCNMNPGGRVNNVDYNP